MIFPLKKISSGSIAGCCCAKRPPTPANKQTVQNTFTRTFPPEIGVLYAFRCMPLPAGIKLGPYEVMNLLGAGGMGEVYQATDTNLGRSVAIKILPEAFIDDVERVSRFEREAR